MFTRGLPTLPLSPERNGRGTSSSKLTSLLQRYCQTSRTCRSLRLAGQRWEMFTFVSYINPDPRSHPQASKDAEHATNGGSPASEQDLQIFMDNFVCQSNAKGIKYFFFELFDEKWKDDIYGGVEGHWGLLYQKCVHRVPSTANADRLPTAKPSKASPSLTVRFNTWTLLHPVTALTDDVTHSLVSDLFPLHCRQLASPAPVYLRRTSVFKCEPSPFFHDRLGHFAAFIT